MDGGKGVRAKVKLKVKLKVGRSKRRKSRRKVAGGESGLDELRTDAAKSGPRQSERVGKQCLPFLLWRASGRADPVG